MEDSGVPKIGEWNGKWKTETRYQADQDLES